MACSTSCQAMIWKSLIRKKSKWCHTICEILLPVSFAVLFLVIRNYLNPPVTKPANVYRAEEIINSVNLTAGSIIFTPETNLTNDIIQSLKSNYAIGTFLFIHFINFFCTLFYFSEFQGYSSEEKLEQAFETSKVNENDEANFYENGTRIIAGIVFGKDFDYYGRENNQLPNLDYKIRMDSGKVESETKNLFPLIDFTGPGYHGKQKNRKKWYLK